jgi:hypothetical protein
VLGTLKFRTVSWVHASNLPELELFHIAQVRATAGVQLKVVTASLVTLLNRAPRLERLELFGHFFEYEPVCHALSDNRLLSSFHWRFDSVEEELRRIDCFVDFVKNYNVTLTDVWCPAIGAKFDFSSRVNEYPPIADVPMRGPNHYRYHTWARQPVYREQFPQLHYYLDMNRFGRHAARNPATNPASFVKKLSIVSHRIDLLFGLLREAPSLWCGTSSP